MKKATVLFFLFSFFVLTTSFSIKPVEMDSYSIQLEIDGIKKENGTVIIAFYESEEKFLETDLKVKHISIPVQSKKVTTSIELRKGEFALAVFHDENNNKKLDTNILGIPKEPYGFSNNARKTFSAPDWKDCKINIDSAKKLNIHLK